MHRAFPRTAAPRGTRPRGRVLRRAASALLAVLLGLSHVAPAHAQGIDDLPRLGSAGGDELTPAAERKLGERVMRELRSAGVVHDDAELTDWLGGFASTLAATRTASGADLEFFLVQDGSINAFALPGGWIGVHTGLVVAAQTESQLASVLAHEIGHVTQRHIARMLAQQRQGSLLALAGLVLGALAARSSPDAFIGIATLGQSLAMQRALSFSRDAEREADRIGFEMLGEGGFDPNGAVEFFGRLQQANRIQESSAPVYLRTHPLTADRIADMQSRIREQRYRQRPDRLEFRLVRAKLRALQDTSVDGLRGARTYFDQLQRGVGAADPVPWFGVATAALAQRDFDAARRALGEARTRVPGGSHPFLERLGVDLAMASQDAAAALAAAKAARARYPDARSIARLHARALLNAGDARAAVSALRDQLALRPGDATMWRMLSDAHASLGDAGQAHRAAGEGFALSGALAGAIEQFQLAQRAGGLDFITASLVDTRLRVLREQFAEDEKERRR